MSPPLAFDEDGVVFSIEGEFRITNIDKVKPGDRLYFQGVKFPGVVESVELDSEGVTTLHLVSDFGWSCVVAIDAGGFVRATEYKADA